MIAHMVQEAAQTTTNVPTVFKPFQPLLVAEERKVKDSKTVLIHLVYVQTGQVVPISACWMTSRKMVINAFAHQVTPHPPPILKQTSSQNVPTLTNALLKLTTVIPMQHVTTTQVVTHAAVTQDSDKLVMVMLVNVVTLMNVILLTQQTIVTKMLPVVIPSEAMNVNVTPVTEVTVSLVTTLMNVQRDQTTVMLTLPVLTPLAVSLALVTPAGTLVETVMKVHATMLTSAQKTLTHTPVVPTQNVSIAKVHMTVNAYHHSIFLKALVLMTMNVVAITTIATKVDLFVPMKLRHTQWNGSVVLPHTQ